MKKYAVTIREIWHQTVVVEASTKNDAIQAVEDGEGIYGHPEYYETMEGEDFVVSVEEKIEPLVRR